MLFKRIVIIHTQDLGSRTESNLYAHMLMLDTHGVSKKGDLSSDLELILVHKSFLVFQLQLLCLTVSTHVVSKLAHSNVVNLSSTIKEPIPSSTLTPTSVVASSFSMTDPESLS